MLTQKLFEEDLNWSKIVQRTEGLAFHRTVLYLDLNNDIIGSYTPVDEMAGIGYTCSPVSIAEDKTYIVVKEK